MPTTPYVFLIETDECAYEVRFEPTCYLEAALYTVKTVVKPDAVWNPYDGIDDVRLLLFANSRAATSGFHGWQGRFILTDEKYIRPIDMHSWLLCDRIKFEVVEGYIPTDDDDMDFGCDEDEDYNEEGDQ